MIFLKYFFYFYDVDLSRTDIIKMIIHFQDNQNGTLINLRGVNLEGIDLSKLDLSNIDFSNSNLSNSDLSLAIIKNSKFRNAKMNDTKISWVKYNSFNYSDSVDFGGADLRGASFHGSKLSNANFERANLKNANLQAAGLARTNLKNCNLENADLSFADLKDADLSGANLSYAYLNNVQLNKANFTNSNLEYCYIESKYIFKTEFYNSNLNHTTFNDCQIDRCIFKDVSFKFSIFSGTSIVQTNFDNSNFRNTHFLDVSFENVKLKNVDAKGSEVINCISTNSKIFSSSLECSLIKNSGLHLKFNDCNISNSEIFDSNFDGSDFKNVDFQNTIVNTHVSFNNSNIEELNDFLFNRGDNYLGRMYKKGVFYSIENISSERKKLINKSKIIFLDFETTGLPINQNSDHKELKNWPYIVQASWIISDSEENQGIKEFDFILKPEKFKVPKESKLIHGISNKIARSDGKNRKTILSHISVALKTTKYIVAHNTEFDIKVLRSEFYRNDIHDPFEKFDDYFEKKFIICTMTSTTHYCQIPRKAGGYKYPSLLELYTKLFNEDPENLHNSKYDSLYTMKCFWRLYEKGIVELR